MPKVIKSKYFETQIESLPKVNDIIGHNMKILFCGINPGITTSLKGHHYAGHSNSFWPCLSGSGLVKEKLTYKDDTRLLKEYAYGLTNIVDRPTKSMNDIKKEEFNQGSISLKEKIFKYNPLIVCFVGKKIYEVFSKQSKCNLGQQNKIDGCDSIIYVMPSTSGLNFRFNKQDKLQYFKDLKNILEMELKEKEKTAFFK